ncbi:diguanylate cyclase [Fulvivirgaceae bacterium BMA10]|uniref:Diguanylate cyclase n=1 Tax=Splendidivirga corallicola TaxID=3051826 RepID=A0ABT8KW26_9BACT|nr:diguanylate cyclase [Fulvivirgaceae bacterium BMA10]
MKPIDIKLKYSVLITLLVAIFVILEFVDKGIKLSKVVFPNGELNIWNVILLCFLSVFITWFIMNHYLNKEHKKHSTTKLERDNLKLELGESERQKHTDHKTGIPNYLSLQKTIKRLNYHDNPVRKYQFILIDLKGFKTINDKDMNDGDKLLRAVGQYLYTKMRRNENIYRYPDDIAEYEQESFFRLHTGGDEFVFLIKGNQVEGLGFVNRLARNDFKELSIMTEKILGRHLDLSFHCSVTEIDSKTELKEAMRECIKGFSIAKKGTGDFNICWHPNNVEKTFTENWELNIYKDIKEKFNVLTMEDIDY